MKHHILNNKIDVMETRPRVLLLNKSEINKIQSKIHIKGYTCVPSRLFRNERGKWKLEIALVTGKNTYNKKQDILNRDLKRDSDRQLKGDN
jgi:SsrA-binding protein